LTVRRDPGAASSFRLIDSLAPTLTLTGLRLTGGNPAASGGAINEGGTAALLTLDGVVIGGNAATGSGGAIFVNTGTSLSLKNSTLSGNTATTVGGGVYFFNGGGLVMDNTTVGGNLAGTNGGGITWFGTASATPPAGFTAGTVVVQNSTFNSN